MVIRLRKKAFPTPKIVDCLSVVLSPELDSKKTELLTALLPKENTKGETASGVDHPPLTPNLLSGMACKSDGDKAKEEGPSHTNIEDYLSVVCPQNWTRRRPNSSQLCCV
jgi:hypothetical protein